MSKSNSQTPAAGGSLADWLELMRLPNVFTALADVAMGMLFVLPFGVWPEMPLAALLLCSSATLYMAGVVLNDVLDFEEDKRLRPERPLPSGRIPRSNAASLGVTLLLVGAACGWVVALRVGFLRPGTIATLLVACILGYDALLKRTPVGPLAMGACRMLNVLLGMSVAVDAAGAPLPWQPEHWLVAGAIGTYIAGVTWFARREGEQSNRLVLVWGLMVLLAGIGLLGLLPLVSDRLLLLLAAQPQRWYTLLVIFGLLTAWRCFAAVSDPQPIRVQRAVGHCILSLVVLDAAACYAVQGIFWATMILLLIVPTMLFARVLPST